MAGFAATTMRVYQTPLKLARLKHKLGALGLSACLLETLLCPAARAEEPSVARLTERAPVNVWYRGSASCPDGAAFIQLVAQRTARARLAEVGDRIDFVLTIGSKGDSSTGRLERQTAQGTIAIRELTGSDCNQIADALALTLALTVEPDQGGAKSEPTPPAATQPPESPAVHAVSESALERQPPARPNVSIDAGVKRDSERRKSSELRASAVLVGLLLGGVAPTELPAAGVFGQAALLGNGPWKPSVRAGLLLASASADGLRTSLLAGRAELCPIGLMTGELVAQPCVDVEVGRLSAEHARARNDARDLWVNPGLLARLGYRPFRPVQFELSAGVSLPVTRYSVELSGDSPEQLYRTARLGSQVGMGAEIELP